MNFEKNISLKILIIDNNDNPGKYFKLILSEFDIITEVELIHNLEEAKEALKNYYNVVYIDPIDLGFIESSQFINNVRVMFPETVYVIFSEQNEIYNQYLEKIFGGYLLKYYFNFDKKISFNKIRDRVRRNIIQIQDDFDLFVIKQNNVELIERLRQVENNLTEKELRQTIVSSVKEKIQKNQIEDSLNMLNIFFEQKVDIEGANFITMQLSAFKRLQEQNFMNLITQEQFEVGISRIIHGVLNLALKKI